MTTKTAQRDSTATEYNDGLILVLWWKNVFTLAANSEEVT